MDINNIIDRLNNELDKLNKLKAGASIDTNDFFTDNESFNDDLSLDDLLEDDSDKNIEGLDLNNINSDISKDYSDIEPDTETVSLVTIKEKHLLTMQTMFKKSIRVSLKSFLISITLSFLNLFIWKRLPFIATFYLCPTITFLVFFLFL